ncbi:MAG: transglycosylase domain-containing protein [Chloroflexi bacterium]|nr:transglycosylase domain-containing protein [Chloroflexota bacterium]
MTTPPIPDDYEDDDVPFQLPKADNYRDDDRLSDSELRAQDQPLRAEPTADLDQPVSDDTDEIPADVLEQMRTTRRPVMPPPTARPSADEDVHFSVPHTVRHRPSDHPDTPTLIGTGGLDPNPDMTVRRVDATIQSPVARPPDAQFQRPPAGQTMARPGYAPPPTLVGAPPVKAQGSARRKLPSKRRRGLRPGCVAIALGVIVTLCGGLTLLTVLIGGIAYARVGDLLNERLANLDTYNPFQTTFLLDRNGRELYQIIGEGRRTRIPLAEIPKFVIDATVATEDDEFWTNIGIDIAATTLAVTNFVTGDVNTAGGSTITQQLVRNVLFDAAYRSERTATRKAEEIALAIALTTRESKERILELYLNEIYYGNLAYGIEAAAQTFFSKPARALTLAESALLAGLPQAPRDLDPLNPDPAVQSAVYDRWRLVLDLMLSEDFITQAEHDAALRDGYTLVPPEPPLNAPHFTFFARDQWQQLMESLGYSPDVIAAGGFRVYTTVDIEINNMAQAAVREQIARLGANNVTNGAVVVLKPITGEILAMVGSADYDNEAIDGSFNVTLGLRQPGSTVKAFTYAAALERGMSPGDVIWDTRTEIGIPGQPPYVPVNYDNTFHGPMRMRTALANSYNIPAVQTLRHNVGVAYYIDFVRRLGMTSVTGDPSLYGLSITLGGAEVSPLELTRGFSVFANEGVFVDSEAILCVLDSDGRIVYQYENACPSGTPTPQTVDRSRLTARVLDPRIAYLISDVLSDNAARSQAFGSNSILRTPFQSSVKTGTTNEVKDNWTVGFTRNVAVGVWVGNSDGSRMVNTSGVTGAAPIWNQVITTIYSNSRWLDQFKFQGQLLPDQAGVPQGMSRRSICDVRALQDPAGGCPAQVTEWFLDGPAGVPDGSGGLAYPQQQPPPQPDPNSSAQLVSPGVYQSWVTRLSPEVSNAIQFSVAPGQKRPPAPIYCRVPPSLLGSASNAQQQLFIAPPPDGNDAADAESYARSRGLAFLPTVECSADLAAAGGGFGSLPSGVVNANVTFPAPGEVLGGVPVPILGTIDFAPGQVSVYRFLIRGPQFPEWTMIGEQHNNPVVNGQLEVLYPPYVPGAYELKLEILAPDSSLIQVPITVPFNVQ